MSRSNLKVLSIIRCVQCWNPAGAAEDELLNWLLQEPQTIVWLPTMHRVTAAESVKHEAKCNCCRMFPIVGIRYRCLRCFNYDLCQHCFLTGRATKKHKAHHPIQEHCVTSSIKEDTKAILRTFRYNLSQKRRRKKKLRYLPISSAQPPYQNDITDVSGLAPGAGGGNRREGSVVESSGRASKCLQTELCRSADGDGTARDALQMAVSQLEEENRQLLAELEQAHSAAYTSSQRSSPSDCPSEATTAAVDWLTEENDRLSAERASLRSNNTRLQQRLRTLEKRLEEPEQPTRLNNALDTIPSSKGGPPSAFIIPPSYQTPLQTSRPSWHRPPAEMMSSQTVMGTPTDVTRPSVSVRDDSWALSGAEENSPGCCPSALRTQFLPSDEESISELDTLVKRFEQTYPLDATHDQCDTSEAASRGEMLRAAANIGDAFSQFVGNVANATENPSKSHEDTDDTADVPVPPPVMVGGTLGYHGYISNDSDA